MTAGAAMVLCDSAGAMTGSLPVPVPIVQQGSIVFAFATGDDSWWQHGMVQAEATAQKGPMSEANMNAQSNATPFVRLACR